MNAFRRQNPSPRYRELVALYQQMHVEGLPDVGRPPEKTFPGVSLKRHVAKIGSIIGVLGSETILDYGSGKGHQYGPVEISTPDGHTYNSVKEFWRVNSVTCYDPAYEPFSELPEDSFDGVVSTDILEHCPKDDIPWIIDEIFSFAREFVFLNVACFPAKKNLPNGENAHCTIEPVNWWKDLLDEAVAGRPGLRYYTDFFHPMDGDENGGKLVNSFIKGKASLDVH